MAGIIFLKTSDRNAAVEFYRTAMGMTEWVEQPGISILQHENLLIGFIQTDGYQHQDDSSLVTFFYRQRSEVDSAYRRLERMAENRPQENARFRIYNFYARDPEGRRFEVQTFLHDVPPACADDRQD
ncbi:MAG: VOC family protein [Spirochaetota bacterium]